MSKLSFDSTENSSDFILKMEQMSSAIRATALVMEEQEERMGSSFQHIADNACLNATIVANAVREMHKQISDTIIALRKLDLENQSRLVNVRSIAATPADVGGVHESAPTTKDPVRNEISSRENLSVDVSDQYNALTELSIEIQVYQQRIELAKKELTSLRTELILVCDEMEKMRKTGQENTETYAALQTQAVELSNSINQTNEQLSQSPVSNETFEGLKSGLEGVSGAFSAASSVMGIFSKENEYLQSVMEKVGLAITVVNGLQEVNSVLSKNSAFHVGVLGRLKLWMRNIYFQVATAQGVESAAAAAGTGVNWTLAASFHAIGLAIKSIPIFGWIVAGISALISVYSLWSSSTEDQQVKQNELNQSVKEFNDRVQSNAAKPIAMVELLSTKFKALGDNINAQKKFIADHKKEFDELGVSINTVKDAQQLLIDNKDKFIKAQIDKAISLAYAEKMQEEAKKYIESKTAEDTWHRAGEMKKAEGADNFGIVDEERIKEYKIKEDGYANNANKVYANMQHLSYLSMAYSNKSDAGMVEFNLKNKDSNSNKKGDQKTDQVKEAENKVMELLKQQNLNRERFAKESANKMAQAEIDAKVEGTEKVCAQMMLNHEKELQELDREREELKQKKIEEAKVIFDANENLTKAKNSKYEKQQFNPSTVSFDDADFQKLDIRQRFISQKHTNEITTYDDSLKQAHNEYLKEYGNFIEKRNAIIALGESKKKGKNEWEVLAISEETKNALSDLDIEENKDKSAFGKLFSDVKDGAVKDMRIIVAEAQSALDFVKEGKWDQATGEKFHMSKETFDITGNSPEKIKEIEDGIKSMNEQADASDTALNRMGIGFQKLFDAESNPEDLKNALGEIESAMNEVMQSTQFFSDCLAGLGDAMGSDALSGVAEGMNVAMDAANATMSGAKAGAMFGPWGAAAGAAIGLVSSLGSSLAKLHDAKKEKNIQRIQEQIEVLEKSYSNLGESLDKAFSSDASELIDQQNTMLEQQKVLIRNQIAEEESKKKADGGRIEEWNSQIEEIDKVIAGNKEKKIDVIFGEDLKSAINNFAQAYADAWSAGDDRAKSSKDLVKDMIKQMISEAIKAASSGPMEKLRERLAGFFSDGIISAWEREQIEKDAENLMNDLDNKFGWADEYMKGEEEGTSQDSSKNGFANMSQETGEELNGRFTALQISNEEIKNSMLFILGNLSALCTTASDSNILLTEMRNLSVMSNGHLEDIAKYTKVLLGFGTKLDDIAFNTKSLTVK